MKTNVPVQQCFIWFGENSLLVQQIYRVVKIQLTLYLFYAKSPVFATICSMYKIIHGTLTVTYLRV